MEKLLLPANINPVILLLSVSVSILEANNSVQFYFYGSKDDARFLFVDEDVVLMCEAKGFLNPTFKMDLNGDELFDGNRVVAPNQSRFNVNVMGSCLQLTIKRLALSLKGEYTCLASDSSSCHQKRPDRPGTEDHSINDNVEVTQNPFQYVNTNPLEKKAARGSAHTQRRSMLVTESTDMYLRSVTTSRSFIVIMILLQAATFHLTTFTALLQMTKLHHKVLST
ncbi:hypothetical protein HOLleu_26843 [Holothuria leucospilota]|uniref:Uncharacterized protein n=1 Tax=Holothuria leucospilota TaxID=206669 RepID=A0A9Q1H0D4_HOLLE|nr:hypothetical protein HOLleu_26843 [Holothuria leucospilota]